MHTFWKQATLMFLALRAGDFVNLAAGMWLVPKFVAPDELGAVLPITSLATVITIPVFAFAMCVMKEAADLAGFKRLGQLKSLWRGAFLAVAALTLFALLLAFLILPRYLPHLKLSSGSLPAALALAAALLGSVAPVYTDALQAVKRFRALAAVECLAALARFAALALLMPFRALAGYFAGNALQPITRIAVSLFTLRRPLVIPAERYWTRENVRSLAQRFAWTTLYLAVPMAVGNLELTCVRTMLATTDSAAYYVLTRLSDLPNYLTYPLLIVLFPYAADAARSGQTTRSLVIKSSTVTLVAAIALGIIYAFAGRPLLALIPQGSHYASHLPMLPVLLGITALTACQIFYTNAEVAAGRFAFLCWFLPINFIYASVLLWACHAPTLATLLNYFLAAAILRFLCAAFATFRDA